MMPGHEWGKSTMYGGHGMGGGKIVEMMVWRSLNPDQQRALMLRALDLKIRKKEFLIYTMQEKVKLMQEKLNLYRMARDMLAGGMGGQGFR